MGWSLAIIALAVASLAAIAAIIALREILPRASARSGYLEEQLPYRQLLGDGLALLDRARLLTVFKIGGKDFTSLTYRQQAAVAATAAMAIADVEQGVEIRWRHRRHSVTGAPKPTSGPRDALAATLYELQFRQYDQPNVKFDYDDHLVMSWAPPPKVLELLSRSTDNSNDDDSFETQIGEYESKVGDLAEALEPILKPKRLSASELGRFLRRCATFEDFPFEIPESEVIDGLFVRPYDLTGIIADQDILPDFVPRVGEKWVEVISVETIKRGGTTPGALDRILQLKMPLEVDVRCIKLSPEDVAKVTRSAWNKQRGKSDPRSGQMRNLPAEARAAKAQSIDPESATLLHWNIKVIVADEDRKRAMRAARFVKRQLNRAGFGARIERLGNPDAFIATLPGKIDVDITESTIDELTAADLAPLNAIHRGATEHPHPRRKGEPPVIHGLGLGNTPVDVYDCKDDVAHMGFGGPIGSGKSTVLAMCVASDRMMTSTVDDIVYDQGRSVERIIRASGGNFFQGDPGDPEGGINPYAGIEDEARRRRVELWHYPFFEMCKVDMNDRRKETLRKMLALHAKSKRRSPTLFTALTETTDSVMARALSNLTIKGAGGHLFDTEREDHDLSGGLQCFEMGKILRYKNDLLTGPFVTLTFDRVLEQSERSGRHVRVHLDEAHEYFKHPVFAPILGTYYDQARKIDGGIRMFFQRIQQFLSSPIAQTVIDCTPQWGFFAYPALVGDQRKLFIDKFPNMTEEICDMIAHVAQPKRHVVMWDGEHAMLINQRIAPEVLTIVGASSKDDRDELDYVRAHCEPAMLPAELWRRRGQHEAAKRYLEIAAEYGIISKTEAA